MDIWCMNGNIEEVLRLIELCLLCIQLIDICMCEWMNVCKYYCTYIWAFHKWGTLMNVCMYACVCIYGCMPVYVFMCVCMYVCMYVLHVCICIQYISVVQNSHLCSGSGMRSLRKSRRIHIALSKSSDTKSRSRFNDLWSAMVSLYMAAIRRTS